ncbi:uncharacterized protein LOC144618572 [Crassostrea virginica]
MFFPLQFTCILHIHEPCGIPSRRPQSHGTIVRTKGLHRKYQPLTGDPVTCDRGGDRREIDPERAWCEFVAEFAEQRVNCPVTRSNNAKEQPKDQKIPWICLPTFG